MPDYRLLALDMDGTLLTSDKRISPRTREAIRAATSCGVAVALSTGRALNELTDYRDLFRGSIRYASLLSGGHVHDLDNDQPIGVRPLDVQATLGVAAIGLRENAMVHVLTTSQTAAVPRDIDRMDEVGMGVYQEMFRRLCTPVDDIATFIASHGDEICKINLYHRDQPSRSRSLASVREMGVQAVFAEETAVECTPVGVTKALGLRILCDHLGITLDECIAIGDSSNDLDALRAAGLAVAMGNANDEVRQLADVVVADNDHDGIAEAIGRYIGVR